MMTELAAAVPSFGVFPVTPKGRSIVPVTVPFVFPRTGGPAFVKLKSQIWFACDCVAVAASIAIASTPNIIARFMSQDLSTLDVQHGSICQIDPPRCPNQA